MQAINFFMIDLKRTKAQVAAIAGFAVLSVMFMSSSASALSGYAYMTFAAIIMDGAVFTQEQKFESGWLNLLPASDLSRVTGRYIYQMFIVILSLGLNTISTFAYCTIEKVKFSDTTEAILICFAIATIICSLQNIAFYAIGKGKSQQLMSLIHMLPGFFVYALILPLFDIFGAENSMKFIFDNLTIISIASAFVSIIIWIASILTATKIVSKKDFA